MQHRIGSARPGLAALGAAFMLAALPGVASADKHERGLPAGAGRATYTAECGSCHVAYPPRLLSASSWNRVMAGLDKHFGVDATVDGATARTLGAYLADNAGAERRLGASTLRISETPWFRHEHDEVSPATWKSPQVKTAANCAACHPGAERGDYNEHAVRLPVAARR